jgi:predicted RNA-binding Zn-ribbon protein involved in translation (DUF1610 family)
MICHSGQALQEYRRRECGMRSLWNDAARCQRTGKILRQICKGEVGTSPEFKELLCPQCGNKRIRQRCHQSRLGQFQPVIDTTQVAHPLYAEQPLHRINEGEAQDWRILGIRKDFL